MDSTTKRLKISDVVCNMFRSVLALSPGGTVPLKALRPVARCMPVGVDLALVRHCEDASSDSIPLVTTARLNTFRSKVLTHLCPFPVHP